MVWAATDTSRQKTLSCLPLRRAAPSAPWLRPCMCNLQVLLVQPLQHILQGHTHQHDCNELQAVPNEALIALPRMQDGPVWATHSCVSNS
jgi:hypothetical protein